VRVEGAATSAKVKITLAFDEWKEGKVAPATFEIPISGSPMQGKN
jgi:hypothetical protein